MTKTTMIALGALVAASAAGASAAQAGGINFAVHVGASNAGIQYVHGGGHVRALGPHEIRRALRHYGFYEIRSIERRGPVYVALARGYRGALYAVRLNARNGRILSQDIVWRGGRGGHHGGHFGGHFGGYHGGHRGVGIHFGF